MMTNFKVGGNKIIYVFTGVLCVVCLTMYFALRSMAATTLTGLTVEGSDSSLLSITYETTNGQGDVLTDYGNATVSGNVITLTARAYKSGSCPNETEYTVTTKLTISSTHDNVYINYTVDGVAYTDVLVDGTGETFECKSETVGETVTKNVTINSIWQKSESYITLVPSMQEDCAADVTVNGTTYTLDSGLSTESIPLSDPQTSFTPGTITYNSETHVFEGWSFRNDSGVIKRYDNSSSAITLPAGTWYLSPVFRPVSASPIFQVIDGEAYYYLDEAMGAAISAASKKVVMTASGEALLANGLAAVIPSTVSFVLSYDGTDYAITADGIDTTGFSNANYGESKNSVSATSTALNPENNVTYSLTVPENITIINNGKIAIGGVIHGSSGVSGATGGTHSNIVLDGNLRMGEDSILSVCGYIIGDGTLTATASGAKVYQPFVVCDFRSGGYTVGVSGKIDSNYGLADQEIDESISPFTRYSVRNIQVEFVLGASSALYGYCDLYANSQHNRCTAVLAGSAGLIILNDGAKLTATYGSSDTVAAYPWFGRNNIMLDGGASFGSMVMNMNLSASFITIPVSIATENIMFPVPYNFSIALNSGDFVIAHPLQFMPGSELIVGENATLSISDRVMFMDQFDDTTYMAGNSGASEYEATYYGLTKVAMTANDTVSAKYFESVDAKYVNASNIAIIYHGVDLEGNECYRTVHGFKVDVVLKEDYKQTSSTTKSAIVTATLASDSNITVYGGYHAVSMAYLTPKGLSESYYDERYGTVVEEYGTYYGGFDSTLIYKVDNGDGTYTHKWHYGGFEITTIQFYGENIRYARYKNDSGSTVNGYLSGVYLPYTATSTPSAIKSYGTAVRQFCRYDGSIYIYEVEKADGTLVYFHKNSSVYTEVDVAFDPTGEYIIEASYTENGVKKYKIARYTIKEEFRDPNNTRRASSHYAEDGTVYYRYGSNVMETGDLHVVDGWVQYITYTVPATSAYTPLITLFENDTDLKDGSYFKVDENGEYVLPQLERRSVAQYDLVIDGKNYGRAYYEYVDLNGKVLAYTVYADSVTSYSVWYDGTYVNITTASAKRTNSETGKDATIYYATKVTRVAGDGTDLKAYYGSISESDLNVYYTSTTKPVSASHRYPSGDMLRVAFGNESANLIVNGIMYLKSGASFGGIVQTAGGKKAELHVAADVVLEASARTGGAGTYSVLGTDYIFTGATVRALKAQVYSTLSDTLVDIVADRVYYASSATFSDIPFSYTLYHSVDLDGNVMSTTIDDTVLGKLQGVYQGEWYTENDIYAFKAEYRLADYIWLNASFKVGSAVVVPTGIISTDNDTTFVNADGTYYLVRKVTSDELTSDIQIDISSLFGAATGTFVANGSFERVKEITTDEKMLALIDAMLEYGAAAKTYFSQGTVADADVIALPDGLDTTLSKLTGGTTLDGFTISTAGVEFTFNEQIGMTLHMGLKQDGTETTFGSLDNIVQVGVLVGDAANGKVLSTNETTGYYDAAYILYQSEQLTADNPSYPDIPANTGYTTGTIVTTESLSDLTEAQISFDLKSAEYDKTFSLRLYIVVDNTPDDETDDYFSVLYGTQYHYGLGNYIARTYNSEYATLPDGYDMNAYKNFMVATWNYREAAVTAFGIDT